MTLLKSGYCEPLKAGVHGAALGLAGLMGLYNAAAWLQRRERHLAVNAVLYSLAVAWERRLVVHHLDACRAASLIAPAPHQPIVEELPCEMADAA